MAPFRLRAERIYHRPASELWPIVADLGGYAEHVDGLRATEVLSGDGVGAVRRCTNDKDQSWTEVVTAWEPGCRYRVEVDTGTYPTPLRQLFRTFAGTWQVEERDGAAIVSITFDADVRGGRLLTAVVRRMADRAAIELEETLDSYGAYADREATNR